MLRVLALWGGMALGLVGCPGSARPEVERVVLGSAEGLDVLGLTKEQLTQRLESRLRAAKFNLLSGAASSPTSAGSWRVIAHIQAEEPNLEGGPIAQVAAAVSLHQRGGSESWQTQARARQVAASNSVADIQSAARASLEEALGRSVDEARWVVEGLALKEDVLVGRLRDGDAARVDAALQVLARRRNKAVLPLLISRLGAVDIEVLHRTMGFAVDLKDPGAVPALIEASRGRDSITVREIVFSLGEIGGPEAEAFLFTVSRGHDDPVLRASAERALEDLKSRASKAREKGE